MLPVSQRWARFVCVVLLAAAGCKPPVEARFPASEQVKKLEEKLQQDIHKAIDEHCGTPSAPKMLGEKDGHTRLLNAQALYLKHCEQCHGFAGDGQGPAAKYLYPKPRDYRKGIFKFTSTSYGSRPRRVDLDRTLEKGIPGTSMPAFRLLPKAERELLVDYVLMLSLRGELEAALAYEAEAEDAVDPEIIPESIEGILGRWKQAELDEVHPLTPVPPVITAEMVHAGRAAFLSRGCSKCHGEDGRGQTRDNIGKDTWGNVTKAADLTSGLLHGGHEPLDVYRRINSGINGTPMPGFRALLQQEPDTLWNLAAYVLYVSNQRRSKVMPAPGVFSKTTPEAGTAVPADASQPAE